MPILVIEDHKQVRENICEILELENYIVRTAENGLQGLSMARQIKPRLILCDVSMPLLNGYEVINQLKQDTAVSHIPFFFLSAFVDKFEIEIGLRLGAAGYIVKPFDPAHLIKSISNYLNKKLV